MRKIWKSDLYSRNKVQAHNAFAVPVLTPTFSILDWTKEEIHDLDVKTRKILTVNGSFHRNGDIDRLYTSRKTGGRGLKSIYDSFVARLISVANHIASAANHNRLLAKVRVHEQERLLRTSSLLKHSLGIHQSDDTRESIAPHVKDILQDHHRNSWINKPLHGYLIKKQTETRNYCSNLSNIWLLSHNITSHTEGYFCAVQEQEIRTRALEKQRAMKGSKTEGLCWHCLMHDEDICHVIGSCSRLSSSMYLPFRHDQVARLVYNQIIRLYEPSSNYQAPQPVYTAGETELWWDMKIPCTPAVEFNRPDIVIWHKIKKTCQIIEVGTPLDVNVDEAEVTKQSKYVSLAVNLKRVYKEYQFECIPIVVGATGYIPKSLPSNLKSIGFDETTIKRMLVSIAEKIVSGTVKIAKSALSLKK